MNSLFHSAIPLSGNDSKQNKTNYINDKNLSCPCCGKHFMKKKRLEIHIRSHVLLFRLGKSPINVHIQIVENLSMKNGI